LAILFIRSAFLLHALGDELAILLGTDDPGLAESVVLMMSSLDGDATGVGRNFGWSLGDDAGGFLGGDAGAFFGGDVTGAFVVDPMLLFLEGEATISFLSSEGNFISGDAGCLAGDSPEPKVSPVSCSGCLLVGLSWTPEALPM
jgi:hypothetical protein